MFQFLLIQILNSIHLYFVLKMKNDWILVPVEEIVESNLDILLAREEYLSFFSSHDFL